MDLFFVMPHSLRFAKGMPQLGTVQFTMPVTTLLQAEVCFLSPLVEFKILLHFEKLISCSVWFSFALSLSFVSG